MADPVTPSEGGFLAAVATAPEGLVFWLVDNVATTFLGDAVDWLVGQVFTSNSSGPPSDPGYQQTLQDLANIQSQLSTINTTINNAVQLITAELNGISIKQTLDTTQQNVWNQVSPIINAYNALQNVDPSNIDTNYVNNINPQTGMFANANMLHDLLCTSTTGSPTPYIQQVIDNAIANVVPSPNATWTWWTMTGFIKTFMAQNFSLQVQAVMVLLNCYTWASANPTLVIPPATTPISDDLTSISTSVQTILQNIQTQWTFYQNAMPEWLQILDSMSTVVGPSGNAINWTPSTLSSDPSQTWTPSSFLCAVQFPSYWQVAGQPAGMWYAVPNNIAIAIPASSYPTGGGTIEFTSPTKATFPVAYSTEGSPPWQGGVGDGAPPDGGTPQQGYYVGLESFTNAPPANAMWTLTPQANGSFAVANGTQFLDGGLFLNAPDILNTAILPAMNLQSENPGPPGVSVYLEPSPFLSPTASDGASMAPRVLIALACNQDILWTWTGPFGMFYCVASGVVVENEEPYWGEGFMAITCPTPIGMVIGEAALPANTAYQQAWQIAMPGVTGTGPSYTQSATAPLLTAPWVQPS